MKQIRSSKLEAYQRDVKNLVYTSRKHTICITNNRPSLGYKRTLFWEKYKTHKGILSANIPGVL